MRTEGRLFLMNLRILNIDSPLKNSFKISESFIK
jgi:hypothetical protein